MAQYTIVQEANWFITMKQMIANMTLAGTFAAVKAGALAAWAAFAANPMMWVLAGIVAIIAAGVLLYENWESIEAELAEMKANFDKTWPALVATVKGSINSIIGMINRLIDAINSIGNIKIPDWVPSVGGKSVGFNIPRIPALASGGVVNSPTLAMIGEGREPEAVMPLSRLADITGSGTGGTVITFALVINIQGGSGDAYEQVKRGLSEGQDSFRQQIERYLADRRRLSFA